MRTKYLAGNCGAVLIGLSVAYLTLLHGGHITGLIIRTGDFVQYFAISKMMLHGHGGAIYDFHRLSHVEAAVVYPIQIGHGVLPYLYPPYFALLVAPLAALPYALAYLLWLAVNCVLLFSTLFSLEQYAGLPTRMSMWIRLVTVASLPVLETFLLGQVSILILSLLVLCFLSLRSGHEAVAGVALAFALVKPPYVIPFVILLLARRNWRAVCGFGLMSLGLLLAPLPLLGVSIEGVYLRLLLEATKWQGQTSVVHDGVKVAAATYDPHINQSFSGFAQLLLPVAASHLLDFSLTGLALASLGYCAWKSDSLDLPFALATVVAVLINPHVLLHDLTLLLLPTWIGLRFRKDMRLAIGNTVTRDHLVRLAYLPAILVLLYLSILLTSPITRFLHVQAPVIALLALGIWLFLASRRTWQPSRQRLPHLARDSAAAFTGSPVSIADGGP